MTVGVILPDPITNPLFPADGARNRECAPALRLHRADRQHRQRPGAAREPSCTRCACARSDGWISATARPSRITSSSSTGPRRSCCSNRLDENGTPAVIGDDHGGIAAAGRPPRGARPPPDRLHAGPQEFSTGSARLRAFIEVTASHGLADVGELIRIGESFAEATGMRSLRSLLGLRAQFTAVLAATT